MPYSFKSNKLTAIELKVARLVSEAKTSNEIAQELSLSVRTIESHRAHIYHKLKLKNAADLTRYVLINQL